MPSLDIASLVPAPRASQWRATLAVFALMNLLLGGVELYILRESHQGLTAAHVAATTTPALPDAYAGIHLQAHAAIVYDLTTGETLYSQDAEAQLPLASLTKLLTIYAADESLGTSTPVTITDSALAEEGESGFTAGETFAFDDLARLALVNSSNDAAEAIAEAAGARRVMTDETLLASVASALHLRQTYAVNGTGLDESAARSGGYGSAHDVAVLAGALLTKSPAIAHATIEPSITIQSLAGVPHTLPNTNQGVVRVPGILLSKTGFTDLAGGNLVIVYDAGVAHPIAIAVLGSTREGRFSDVNALLSATLRHFAGAPAS